MWTHLIGLRPSTITLGVEQIGPGSVLCRTESVTFLVSGIAHLVLTGVLAWVHAILQAFGVESHAFSGALLATFTVALCVAADDALMCSLFAHDRHGAINTTKAGVADTSTIVAHTMLQISAFVDTHSGATVITFEARFTDTPESAHICGWLNAGRSSIEIPHLNGLALVAYTMTTAVIRASTALTCSTLPARLAEALASQAEAIAVAIVRAALVRAV